MSDTMTEQEADQALRDLAERKRVARLSDADVIRFSGNGKFGPAIIGHALYERASKMLKETGGGKFGPALLDPDYDTKQKAKRAAPIDEEADEPDQDDDPWGHITLSGAKVLAQQNGVSYAPRIKRTELIADLVAAGVVPPLPVDDDEPDEDE